MAQLSVLGLLFSNGEMTPSQIAQYEGVRLQTLTRLLAAIEADGYVTRHADAKDGRSTRLKLTPDGIKLLTTYVHHRDASLEVAIFSSLNSEEQRTLLDACELMDRLSNQLQPALLETTKV